MIETKYAKALIYATDIVKQKKWNSKISAYNSNNPMETRYIKNIFY